MRMLWFGFALVFTALTLGGLLVLGRLPWTPAAPFDITGFLWLLTNLGPLLTVAGIILCGCVALYCWVRVALP
jgi:hypothetical protein